MINYAARLAGAATLALAALPIAALATAAHAAPVTIRVNDLDLNSAAGQAAFEQRAEQAAATFCKARMRSGSFIRVADEACISGVKAEVREKFEVAQAVQRDGRGVYATR